MKCFEQTDLPREEIMETLGNMGKNLTISARLWRNGGYSEKDIKQLRGWIKTIKKIEDKMAFNLGI
jgi:hypothetical protein